MTIETKYSIGEAVCLKHDKDKAERLIIGLTIRGETVHTLEYNLAYGASSSWHFEYEIEMPNGKRRNAGYKVGDE